MERSRGSLDRLGVTRRFRSSADRPCRCPWAPRTSIVVGVITQVRVMNTGAAPRWRRSARGGHGGPKAQSAKPNSTAPIATVATSCGQTTSSPAPAQKHRLRECRVVRRRRRHASLSRSTSGMASSGVTPPDSMFMTTKNGIASRPNCGIDRATVASVMPKLVMANRKAAVPSAEQRERAVDLDAE